jgi:pre-mRNA-splicing helicase BRR2
VLCQTTKKEFFKKFLFEPLPVESHLDHVLHDHLNAEIVVRRVENKQDAVDYLTWTFLYWRMPKNPNYYNLAGGSHTHLSEHLSELVETTLADLAQSKCIAVDEEAGGDDEIAPLNLGMIAAYYYLHYTTIELFSRSLAARTKLKGLVEIVCAAAEYDDVPVRRHEERVLRALARRLPTGPARDAKFHDPHVKAELLLQAHFARIALPSELQADLEYVLARVLRLVQACVDVLASASWLEPALAAMELSQLLVQAVRPGDKPLRQLPHITAPALQRAAEASVESIFDLIDLDDAARTSILQMPRAQLGDVARFCNSYPALEVDVAVENADALAAGQPMAVIVTLSRGDEDAEDGAPAVGPAVAPFFPGRKEEGWWLVVGDPESNALVTVKRVAPQSGPVRLEFAAPGAGARNCKLFLMCDCYTGCDQEFELNLDVKDGGGDEDMDDDE